jgi:hypothetical protein
MSASLRLALMTAGILPAARAEAGASLTLPGVGDFDKEGSIGSYKRVCIVY